MRLPATTAIPLDTAPPSRANVERAARELETQFARMLIKSMRGTAPGNPLLGGDTTYRDMYDQQLAGELTKGRGLGLAPVIIRQLSRGGAGMPDGAAGGLPLLPPAAAPMPLASAVAGPMPVSLPAAPALPLAASRAGVSLPAIETATWMPPAAAPASAPFGAPFSAPGASTPALADAPLDTRTPEAFVQSIWPHAQKVAAELGVPARALVAQAALETGWGRRLAGRDGQSSHNLFGIKATGWQGQRMRAATHEYVDGVRVSERADFRAYGSAAESFRDYARLLGRPRYAGARGAGEDTHRFASALQRAGYATDPRYADKITAIAHGATMQRALASLPAAAPATPLYARTAGVDGLARR